MSSSPTTTTTTSTPPPPPTRAAPNPGTHPFHIPTPRLTLRPPTAADVPALWAYLTDPSRTPDPQPDLTTAALRARVEEKWAASRVAGGNAWLVILLRPGVPGGGREEDGEGGEGEGEGEEEILIGFGGYNSFPRTRMLNSAERRTSGDGDEDEDGEEKVLVADVGVGIDTRYQRKGYAREALCAMAQYAFTTLRCGYVHLDTLPENTAFRAVMRDMGLPEKPGSGEKHEDDVFAFAWKSLNYDFDEGTWEDVREGLRARGRWPL